jgi:o-succinylbenzoate synthase
MIANVRVELVAGALESGVRSAAGEWNERRALLLTLESDGGVLGRGEAAPLPGYSPDLLEACHEALAALRPEALGDVEREPDALQMLARGLEHVPLSLPAARFALETALLDLAGKLRGVPAWRLLGEPEAASLPLAALIGAAGDRRLEQRAEHALERGISTLKVKLGVHSPELELAALGRLRAALPAAVKLRLDANQSLSVARLPVLAAFSPEFVEEPLPSRELWELSGSPVALALDESLQGADERELRELLSLPALSAVVLKPMALGGIVRCLTLGRAARERGLGVVVSHLFDGPIGLAAAALVALHAGSPERAMGLDRHAGLALWSGLDVPALTPASVRSWTEPGFGVAHRRDNR